MRHPLALLPLATLLAGGCYNPDLSGAGGFACKNGECPGGFTCKNTLCVRNGQLPDSRASSERRPSERGVDLPTTPTCTYAPGKPIEQVTGLAYIGAAFDYERMPYGTTTGSMASYTVTSGVKTTLKLARRANAGTDWIYDPGDNTVGAGIFNAVAEDAVDCGAPFVATTPVLVVYQTQLGNGVLKMACVGCGPALPTTLDPQPGVGSYVDAVPYGKGCPPRFLVTYQTGNNGGLRRSLVQLPTGGHMQPVVTTGNPYASSQWWDGKTHVITYVDSAGGPPRLKQSTGPATLVGADLVGAFLVRDIDGAGDGLVDQNTAHASMNAFVYVTGGASPEVRYGNAHSVVGAGGLPSIAINGTSEAVAYVTGPKFNKNGAVRVRSGVGGPGLWSNPVTITDADAILIRLGDKANTWEVAYRNGNGLHSGLVTCQ